MYNLFSFAVLSALASQVLAGPIDTHANGILLSREALAEIPEYNPSKRHELSHHEEIGIVGRDLIDHLHENYAHHNFFRDVHTTAENRTLRRYEIPDDLMDLAIRSFPLHKRHSNVIKKRALKKRAEVVTFGPHERRALEKREGADGLNSFVVEKYCGGGARITNELWNGATVIFCQQHNDYLRNFASMGGSPPPSYMSYGPFPLADGGEGDLVFSFGRDDGFPWANVILTCSTLVRLDNCGGQGLANGGTMSTRSKVGFGAFHYAMIPGDITKGQPFNSG